MSLSWILGGNLSELQFPHGFLQNGPMDVMRGQRRNLELQEEGFRPEPALLALTVVGELLAGQSVIDGRNEIYVGGLDLVILWF